MTRPYVQIGATNNVSVLRRHLEEHLPRFTAFPGVAGVVLNGGLSQGYADHLPGIAVTWYLMPDAFEIRQNGGAPVTVGISVLNGTLYNISFVNYATGQNRVWDDLTLWDASYTEILYDSGDLLRGLVFAGKLGKTPIRAGRKAC